MTFPAGGWKAVLSAVAFLAAACSETAGPVDPGRAPGSIVLSAAPAAVTGSVVSYSRDASLNNGVFEVAATVNANGSETSTWFEFGESPDLSDAATTTPESIGAGTVEMSITGTLRFRDQKGITIYYRVVASNAAGTTHGAIESGYYGVPPAPANVTATLTDRHKMALTFESVSTDAQSQLRIDRRNSAGNKWSSIAGMLPRTAVQFVDSTFNVRLGTVQWRVRECNPLGCSDYAELTPAGTELLPPANVRAVSTTPGNVVIAWDDVTSTEDNFEVRRNAASGGTKVWTVPKNTTSLLDTVAAEGVQYYYTVYSRAGASDLRRSVPSDRVDVVPGSGGSPTAPTAVTGDVISYSRDTSPYNGVFEVAATVNANGSETSTWFEFGESPDLSDAATTTPESIGAGTVEVSITGTLRFRDEKGITIYYRVVASNAAGTTHGAIESGYYGVPPAPANVTATLTDRHKMALTFESASTDAQSHLRVERRNSASNNWSLISGVLPRTAVQYVDSTFNVRLGTVQWGVRECNPLGCSAYVVLTPAGTELLPPANVRAVSTTPGNVVIAWDDVTSTEDNFEVRRNAASGGTKVWTVPKNTTSLLDTVAAEGVQYYYTVYSRAGASDLRRSVPSDRVDVVPGSGGSPTAPTAVTGDVISYYRDTSPYNGVFEVAATVNANGSATSTWFEFGESPDLSDAATTTPESIGAGTVEMSITGTLRFRDQKGITIYYRVVASNAAGTTHGAIESGYYGVPPTPANVTATLTDRHKMVITFESVSTDAQSHLRVERRNSADNKWSLISGVLPRTAVQYVDSTFNVRLGTVQWGVRECNPLGCSAYVELTPAGTELLPPANVRAVSTTPGNVVIAWDDVTSTEDNFEVRRTAASGGTKTWTVPKNTTSFADGTALEGVQYYYTVYSLAGTTTLRRSVPSDSVGVVPQ